MAQKRTTTKKSTKSRRSQKKRTQKGKVYIAPYKIIILCAAIIAVCMGLLVVTTFVNQKEYDKQQTFLTEQENQKKQEEQKKAEEQRKAEEKRLAEEKAKAEKAKAEKAKAEKLAKEKATSEKKKKDAEVAAKKTKPAPTEPAPAPEKNAPKTTAPAPAKPTSKTTETVPAKPAPKTAAPTSTKPSPASSKPAESNAKSEQPVRTPNTDAKLPEKTEPAKNSQAPAASTPVTKKSEFNFPPAKNGAQLVILLDDGGQNLNHLQKFLDLPFPVTIAVLPQLAHSKDSAAKIRASGKELMLHQPMQAVNANVNPGPGAITPTMDEAQIKSTLFKNITEIGPIAGFNNHEGSLITADAEKMETVLKYASENGIYFLDSRTNVDTKVPLVAHELGLSYYERNGRFLDNVKTRENAITEIRKNLDIANRDGVVIMIGHIWSADFLPAALMEVYPELVEKGYKFTTVSKSCGLKR